MKTVIVLGRRFQSDGIFQMYTLDFVYICNVWKIEKGPIPGMTDGSFRISFYSEKNFRNQIFNRTP